MEIDRRRTRKEILCFKVSAIYANKLLFGCKFVVFKRSDVSAQRVLVKCTLYKIVQAKFAIHWRILKALYILLFQ